MEELTLLNKDGVFAYMKRCEEIVANAGRIVLFGSAKCAEKVYYFLNELGMWYKVDFVLDNDILKHGLLFHEKEICKPEDVKLVLNQYTTIIASGAAHIIKNQLLDIGVSPNSIYEFSFTNLQTNPTPFQFITENVQRFKETFEMLEDDRSKLVFRNLLNYKISRDVEWLEDISDDECNQYFDSDIIKLSDEEVVLDCGAYIGDTYQEYLNRLNGKFKKYICFEADKKVYEVLCSAVLGSVSKNVELYNIGCWSCKDRIGFQLQGSGSSCVSDSKENIIDVDAVDNIVCDRVSFVKMDIEGAEIPALYGMRRIISDCSPVLAISIYHSMEDFYKIPQVIQEINPNYKFYIRHYRKLSDSETVCYAISKNKKKEN